ncbi:MAG: F0F1 ATP synthase subunit alpha [Halieaceae bacterium]|nr:F0F1 ATP synthase subunit alpha [Halieaceae bacterium]
MQRTAAWLRHYRFGLSVAERGTLVSVGDGIVWVAGLPSAAIDDIITFEDGSRALVFDLNPDLIGGVLLHATQRLTAGISAHIAHGSLSIPVGDALLGRVIDPLGKALDDGDDPRSQERRRLERRSPPITARDFVHKPLNSGSKIIDTLLPIGKGQRQLILGDEGLGKTSIALDAVINQRGKQVYCIYVLIGQKRSSVVNVLEILRTFGALEYTTLVVAEANALPGLQHQAPFAGCAIAEYWMEQGRDVLIVYDDLATHALNYRELSLLLRRPPGREAYPGDIFSVHARLLERSTCLNSEHGGGSMTALPIVQTQQGEIAAYIPTNLISITDGQIFLDRKLFAGGFRPAIDIGRSVSRIGGAAQHPRIGAECGQLKLDYLRFLELEIFTRFGARMEAGLETILKRGHILRELLKQDRLEPFAVEFHMAWLIAFNDHLLDELEPADIVPILAHLKTQYPAGNLGLEDSREAWSRAVAGWLQ